MITDEDASIAQVLSMVLDHKVTCLSGKVIPIKADSICVHGDGPKALLFVQKIRKALAEKVWRLPPLVRFAVRLGPWVLPDSILAFEY